MRAISKGPEPASLTAHRCASGADYDNFQDKDTLRKHLVKEQRGLCCYCMSRIRPEAGAMKIAHWHARRRHPTEQLDYGNLLGACMGGEGQPASRQHCDTSQADRDISRHPADRDHFIEDLVHYHGDGEIGALDQLFDRELREVLNLNTAFLVRHRKMILEGFKDTLRKRGSLEVVTIERLLRKWNGESGSGELEPYCGVVVYWLRKRLRRGPDATRPR